MIDTLSESLIPIRAVCDLIPSSRLNKRLNYATVWRWVSEGKLETVRAGKVRLTSREAVARVLERGATGDALPQDSAPPRRTRSTAQRKKDHEAAERKLDEMGVR